MSHFLRALELAERGRGETRDHPLVGAVVVRDGEVVGEGWYEYDGIRHAEAIALERAGDSARGATLYVTLEPCSHHGRTPPQRMEISTMVKSAPSSRSANSSTAVTITALMPPASV